ncbi:putative amino acid permease protein [Diplocarpon rosae]|nr:putative amino acid permease protein [Diplocarpon rosae]
MSPPPGRLNVDVDAEKGYATAGDHSGSDHTGAFPSPTSVSGTPAPWTTRFVDSFRRDPRASPTSVPTKRGYDHQAAAQATANTTLSRQLKGRHMQMIAIGGSIGSFLHSQALVLDLATWVQ